MSQYFSLKWLAQRWHRLRLFAMIALMFAVLAGCNKELYRNLGEQDVNEMVVALLRAGVTAQKSTPDGGKSWTIAVDENEVVRAMEVLRAQGLPRQKFSDLGNLFKQDGLVSTPAQERVRFIYGVSQELSHTLSEIDGVVAARVHIVLPNNDPLAQHTEPSSASIFIKYRPDANVASLTPQIKNLVVHSVQGLTYDQVSVAMVPADVVNPLVPDVSAHKSNLVIIGIVLLAVLVVFLALAGGLYFAWRRGLLRNRTWLVPAQYIEVAFGRFRKKSAENGPAENRSAI